MCVDDPSQMLTALMSTGSNTDGSCCIDGPWESEICQSGFVYLQSEEAVRFREPDGPHIGHGGDSGHPDCHLGPGN